VTPPADALRSRMRGHAPAELARGEKLASVAAVLRFAPELEVLLIKRATSPDDPWSGHMAFPGGRKDAGDADLVATAVRETREEVGLDLAGAEFLGRLDDLQAISRARPMDLVIVPHVFLVVNDVSLAPDPREVELALWAPVAPMSSNACATTMRYVRDGAALELPGWQIGEHVVWGLTYRMLERFFDVIR
jgi:8-oxo-dGTP pyrophosphatase MutT (NUDIX family)